MGYIYLHSGGAKKKEEPKIGLLKDAKRAKWWLVVEEPGEKKSRCKLQRQKKCLKVRCKTRTPDPNVVYHPTFVS